MAITGKLFKHAPPAYEKLSDQELWETYHAGDKEALGHLYRRHHRKLFAICFRFAKNKEAAENMKQEIFLKILEKGKDLSEIKVDFFDVWLKRFAYNLWIHTYRKTNNRQRILENLFPYMRTSTEQAIGIDAKRIELCIDKMPNEKYRQLIVLSSQGFDNPAIADLVGIEVKLVRKHKYEARKMFRNILDREGLI